MEYLSKKKVYWLMEYLSKNLEFVMKIWKRKIKLYCKFLSGVVITHLFLYGYFMFWILRVFKRSYYIYSIEKFSLMWDLRITLLSIPGWSAHRGLSKH